VLVREHAAYDEYLFAAVVAMGAEVGLRRPSDQGGSGTLAHQRHHAEAGDHALMPGCAAGIDDLAHGLVGAEMAQFYEQRAARGAKRRVRRPRRIVALSRRWRSPRGLASPAKVMRAGAEPGARLAVLNVSWQARCAMRRSNFIERQREVGHSCIFRHAKRY